MKERERGEWVSEEWNWECSVSSRVTRIFITYATHDNDLEKTSRFSLINSRSINGIIIVSSIKISLKTHHILEVLKVEKATQSLYMCNANRIKKGLSA